MSDVDVETNPYQDLVQNALDQDYNKAGKIFDNLMSVKLNDVLDAEKIRLADQIYNGEDQDDGDEEDIMGDEDDDQLDLDLDAEDGVEEEEVEDELEEEPDSEDDES
ncbi:MAG: hypothetical protein CMO44_00870 [Verrucomicrobiales bacterium]|nr:hypothetical protein [Verrucomicrobiales bacterium]|tara:strand:+ start:9549 stop:9869 length:321 start_codon:yes stop_codon:yes gene_type:complete